MVRTRSKKIQILAKALRKNQTDTEKIMWHLLKQNFPQIHFRRQYQVKNYIVDFVSLKHKLIIECDGGGHSKEKDKERDVFLTNLGYKVFRFWNNEIHNNQEGIWTIINNFLNETPHT